MTTTSGSSRLKEQSFGGGGFKGGGKLFFNSDIFTYQSYKAYPPPSSPLLFFFLKKNVVSIVCVYFAIYLEQLQSKKCYECGEFGHVVKECPNKLKKRMNGRFKESDWCCPMCANINWDWRQHCNKCSTPKPSGATEKRTGRGGGYNEIDVLYFILFYFFIKKKKKKLFFKFSRKFAHTKKKKKKRKKRRKHELSEKEKDSEGGKREDSGMDEGSTPIYVGESDGNPTILVRNLNKDRISVSELVAFFGQIGKVAQNKKTKDHEVQILTDAETQRPTGEALVTYDDAHAAASAIRWFDQAEFLGQMIRVNQTTNTKYTNANLLHVKPK
ncbi:hypothetical protein RFI_11880 [Reticulomyxa filosa]|uniref:Uncharacterized protein n=1 Tax=Reticulomyxa filosa TaxID=46433 RepID=X6NFZ9_RETFI|nr:hypothetical protein RFI_11880 [Reticulomyxa filosa]|eukprot:ETO25255.1 hypothetical protein RFI_11880 [Reticulomyxa filosa]